MPKSPTRMEDMDQPVAVPEGTQIGQGILDILPSPPGTGFVRSNKWVESRQVGENIVMHCLLNFLEVFQNLSFNIFLRS